MHKPLLITLICGLLFISCRPDNVPDNVDVQAESPKPVQTDSLSAEPEPSEPTTDKFGLAVDSMKVQEHEVAQNESLYLILSRLGFTPQQIYRITRRSEKFVKSNSFRPGQIYRTYYPEGEEASIAQLVWQPNHMEYVVFDWQQDSLQVYKAMRPLHTKTAVTSGEINTSLYHTISDQETSPVLGYKMAEIFAWQIDFFGLRQGDRFKSLYKNRYVDGEYLGIGEILAAEFEHRGERFRAYRFQHGAMDGYFNEDGESVQKALLKAPFEYDQRISSHFSHNRLHPITKQRRPHYGVDYAAPTGTPILAVGDGVITEAQYRGANGNIVKIKHNSTYRTAYLHLNGFARGIRTGVRVKQGQVIGYVGSTGRSTGPHLDYRIYQNNRPVNPLTVELPSSESIPDSLMAEFQEIRESYERQWSIEEEPADIEIAGQTGTEKSRDNGNEEEMYSRAD